MPLLTVTVSKPIDPHLSRTLAATLTELTHHHLRKEPALTAVVFNHVPPEHWLIGNASLQELGKTSFALDIKVTAATNVKAEFASYVAAVFAAMDKHLGQLHDTSYVVIHDVAAAAWGYGGATQEFRSVASKLLTPAGQQAA